eukprot:362159-Chlamydomonas_euryale.AAC.7
MAVEVRRRCVDARHAVSSLPLLALASLSLARSPSPSSRLVCWPATTSAFTDNFMFGESKCAGIDFGLGYKERERGSDRFMAASGGRDEMGNGGMTRSLARVVPQLELQLLVQGRQRRTAWERQPRRHCLPPSRTILKTSAPRVSTCPAEAYAVGR